MESDDFPANGQNAQLASQPEMIESDLVTSLSSNTIALILNQTKRTQKANYAPIRMISYPQSGSPSSQYFFVLVALSLG